MQTPDFAIGFSTLREQGGQMPWGTNQWGGGGATATSLYHPFAAPLHPLLPPESVLRVREAAHSLPVPQKAFLMPVMITSSF